LLFSSYLGRASLSSFARTSLTRMILIPCLSSTCAGLLEVVSSCQFPLSASLIPGREIFLADFSPRDKFLPSFWMLQTTFSQVLPSLSPPPEIYLFASLLYFQLPKYCARIRVPQAWKVDACPSRGPIYIFTPFLHSLPSQDSGEDSQDKAEVA